MTDETTTPTRTDLETALFCIRQANQTMNELVRRLEAAKPSNAAQAQENAK